MGWLLEERGLFEGGEGMLEKRGVWVEGDFGE